jgi:AGCS family alanine or glycine:cation symporter
LYNDCSWLYFSFNINGTDPITIFDYTAQHGSSGILKSTELPISGVDLTSFLAFYSCNSAFLYVLTVAVVLFAFSNDDFFWSYYGLQLEVIPF